ncbi:hypothetical protein EG328_010369 [Venturia inaequalis]|uniref:AA9 family lytic polysaccharide monooxygenase n=1 Tax=Venturia inaequalis TaxID=5025 RepID=A0A8H3YNG9_VENIN|nr:hypothetical protein EG328_010369 [Venturia inaequalis]
MPPSHPPSSQAKKQQSISSFFTPKSTAAAKTNPSPPISSASAPVASLFAQLSENEATPQKSSSDGMKRRIESGNSPTENQGPDPKRAKRTSDEDHPPLQRRNNERQSSPTAPPSSERTSKYIFSSSPVVPHIIAEEEPEWERRRKESLHQRFVRKLGRPDSIAELRKRNHVVGEDLPAEGDAEEDEDHEQEEPPPKKGAKAKKGGARANGKLTPMEQQYLEIKRKHMDTIILYEVGYKFRFLGEDARTAAKVLSIVCIPGKFRYDEHPSESNYSKFASASFPIARLHVHVKRLVSAGHKVGVVRQVETAALKAAGDNRNAPFVRKLTNVYTKGTYVDDLEGLEGSVAAPAGAPATGYLLCLTESNARGWGNDEKVHVGIVAVQPATGSIIYDEFEDGFMRSEIETRLLHIAPCEYLIVGDLSNATEKLVKHLCGSKSNVFGDRARVERIEKSKTIAAQAYSHISSFYAEKLQCSASTSNEVQSSQMLDKVHQLSEHVTIGLSAMITHLTEYGLEHIFELTKNFQPFSARTHMLLNGNTLNSLEIYTNQTDNTEKGSLFWTLDRTKTRFGKRMLRNWVGRPLLDKSKLEERTSAVQELLDVKRIGHVDRIKKVLLSVKVDLEKVLVRIYYEKASRPELLGFLQILQRVADQFPHVKAPNDTGFESALLNDAIALLPRTSEEIIQFLDRINVQAAKDDDKYSFFRDEHETDDITDHKLGIAAVEHELNEYRAVAASILGKKKVEYAAVAGIEFLIEVDNSPVANLKKVPASWIVISKTKKVSRFHTPEVVKMLRERDQHKEALAAACDKAFTALLREISGLHQPLRDCIQALAQLDCLLSLTEVASQPGYCKPTFTSSTQIHVTGGRHPMVEQLLLDSYVPNNIHLSNRQEFDTIDPSALLITGPNMGGKSSYVRSVALIAIMGQIGSYVPADSADIGMLDAVFTRMGVFDNMMRGESTFMVELGETSDILKQATPRSLVILDELGRGTSTHDGVAIAEAVLRELVDRGVMTLFITHYQQLARLEEALATQGLKNVHMRFFEEGEEKVTFLYELGEGVAHRSYGLNVARLANVPVSVLEVAAVKSKEMEQRTERRRIENISSVLNEILHPDDEKSSRDARMDAQLGAKRIEWTYTNNIGTSGKPEPWQAIVNVSDPGITCGIDPKPPALKAVARAGSDIVIHWSGIIRMHNGPALSVGQVISLLNMQAYHIDFFKIKGDGFDKAQKKWANEIVMDNNRTDIVRIPSDIEIGLYVFRTELLALHGNAPSLPTSFGGPQFYTHCFNVEITGGGNVKPEGVKFPGAYQPNDPGVKFFLGQKEKWESYPVPGPPVYAGKYDAPSGSPPVVAREATGVFPDEFQKKYDIYKAKQDKFALEANDKSNELNAPKGVANAGGFVSTATSFGSFLKKHNQEGKELEKELQVLRQEAIQLGIATA